MARLLRNASTISAIPSSSPVAGAMRWTVLDSSYALAEAMRAHECAARGSIKGKIVLTVA